MLTPIFGIIWKALVLKYGVEWLSPDENLRKDRATFNTMVWLVLGFTAVGTLLSALGFLALPLKLGGWLLWTLAWLGVFASYFGLGIGRAVALWVFHAVGQVLFKLFVRFGPLDNLAAVSDAFEMWHLSLGGS
jgi:hypothetical protein